jgi:hypothetical protein
MPKTADQAVDISRCSFDPRTLKGLPMGMFHCPECGDMVLAGMKHGPGEDRKPRLDVAQDKRRNG